MVEREGGGKNVEINPFEQRALDLIGSLDVDVLKKLPNIITSYLGGDAEGDKGNIVVSEENRENIKKLLNEGKVVGALLLLSQSVELGPTIRDVEGPIRRSRRRVQAALKEEAVIEIQPPPTTFQTGRASHEILESITKSGGRLEIYNDSQLTFLKKDGRIVGVHATEIRRDENVGEQEMMSVFRRDTTTELDSDPGEESTTGDIAEGQPVTSINFPESLPVCEEWRNRADWALGVFHKELDFLVNRFVQEKTQGSLTPFDIAEMIRNDETRGSLLRLAEAFYVVYGERPGMLLTKEVGEGERDVTLDNLNEFSVLNMLSIARAVLQTAEVPPSAKGNSTGLLVELPMGNTNYVYDADGVSELVIRGGNFDIGRFWMIDSERDDIDLLTKHIEGTFNSQSARYRRRELGESGVYRETRTRLNRNFRSYLQELWRHHGNEIFTKLCMQFEDLKFPGGDGGWHTTFHVDNLPERGHLMQISDYLFQAISQMVWVEKWSTGKSDELELNRDSGDKDSAVKVVEFMQKGGGGGEDFSISVAEIVEFMQKYGIDKRIRGVIRYQTPEEEIAKEVSVPAFREEQIEWVSGSLARRAKKRPRQEDLRLWRTLEKLLGDRIRDIDKRVVQPRELPEPLKDLCVGAGGNFYLPIDRLEARLFPKESEETSVSRAIHFTDEDVRVMWVKHNDHDLRVAINNNGYFVVSGIDDRPVRGRLSSNVRMRNVKEDPDHLMRTFLRDIWSELEGRFVEEKPLVFSSDSWATEETVILPDGKERERVEGKPLVCRQNMMTGALHLDEKLLREAIEGMAGRTDYWGLRELAQLVSGQEKNRTMVLCPMPHHKNVRTSSKAAEYRGDHGLILCYGGDCGAKVSLPGRKVDTEYLKLRSPGTRIEHFKPVSSGRRRDTETVLTVGGTLSKYDRVGRDYVVRRGLDPDNDLGVYGYVPPEFSHPLADFVGGETFKKLRKISGSGKIRLDQMMAFANSKDSDINEGAQVTIRSLLTYLEGLQDLDSEQILERLTVGSLSRLLRRAMIGRNRDGWDRLGGRIHLPTYWYGQKKDGYSLSLSNFNARGVEDEGGGKVYEGLTHLKARSSKTSKKVGDMILRPTPTGVWLRDPEQFQLAVDDCVILFEGPMSAASFGRFRPDLRDISVTVTGDRAIPLGVTFLRGVGIAGDLEPPTGGMERQIRKIFLATDSDQPGVEAFHTHQDRIMRELPEVEVVGVHELLPPEIRENVPPNDIKLFNKGGMYHGKKMDLNDVLLMPGVREKYAYQTDR